MFDWIEEAIKAEEEKWTCKPKRGKEIMLRMKDYERYSPQQIDELKDEILQFVNDDKNSLHDRRAVEGMSSYFFEHVVEWNI